MIYLNGNISCRTNNGVHSIWIQQTTLTALYILVFRCRFQLWWNWGFIIPALTWAHVISEYHSNNFSIFLILNTVDKINMNIRIYLLYFLSQTIMCDCVYTAESNPFTILEKFLLNPNGLLYFYSCSILLFHTFHL